MAPWQTTDFPHGAGTVIAEFSVRADGPIWRAQVPATADGIPTAAHTFAWPCVTGTSR